MQKTNGFRYFETLFEYNLFRIRVLLIVLRFDRTFRWICGIGLVLSDSMISDTEYKLMATHFQMTSVMENSSSLPTGTVGSN